MKRFRLYTSESVTEGHPDKVADRISDSILDALIMQDPQSRVAAETLLGRGLVTIAGEVTTRGYVDTARLVRDTLRDIGYDEASFGMDPEQVGVTSLLSSQSPEIASGVNRSWEARNGDTSVFSQRGAGDQGLMFGYATNETEELMPAPLAIAHRITRKLAELRKNRTLPYLRPDGKAQVTLRYHEVAGRLLPHAVDTVVVSTQHSSEVLQSQIERDVIEQVVLPVIPEGLSTQHTQYFINPSGSFILGGPYADAGLTGRKIIVDTYGGAVPHGGGAFSGKDPTKVDRSAAYYARYIAKNLVAAGLADKALVEIAYAIGKARPVSLRVDSYGTGTVSDLDLAHWVEQHFDARPAQIIHELQLERPIYAQTAAYGHFGRPEFPWENTTKRQSLTTAQVIQGEK
ncbi:methionine adenosyltransferase [Deinococcus misasensis]|uniref:methionine adenosyltransferase n=1 Tax=Deinococcus misasensis TaxID=392413 RepID=UPI0005594B49|nr:methionine adenosyltransferase [Deinococcus misasensis]